MIKKIFSPLIISLAILSSLSSLTAIADQKSVRPTKQTFKGIELYSWQNELGIWRFAVLHGTNRLKKCDEIYGAEIKSIDALIKSIDALKKQLLTLAQNESVFWGSFKECACKHPDKKMIDDLSSFAKKNAINLRIHD